MAIAQDDDTVWRALAHPLRRAILDALADGPRSSGEVVEAVGRGRHVVLQHLAVLRDAGLVVTEAQGRRRVNHLNPVPIQLIYERWVSRYATPWAAALAGLGHTVEAGRDAREEGRDVG